MTSLETSAAEIVCLVDDDPGVLKSIGRLLATEKFSVRSFHQPKGFLEYARNNPVPVVVLDIWMEEMSGLEVQAAVASLSPATRIIIITGRADSNVRQAALDAGAFAFFAKPFDDTQFLSAVHAALARSAG